MKLFMKRRKATDSGPSSKTCQYFLGFNKCQTLRLIQSFNGYLLSTSDYGKCSEINGRKATGKWKYLIKFKEDLNVGRINHSEQRFSGGNALISIWFSFFSCGNVVGSTAYPRIGIKEVRHLVKGNLNSIECEELC